MMRIGHIIAVCGVDGVGKSTLCKGIRRELRELSDEVEFFTRSKKPDDRLSLTNKYVLPQIDQCDTWLRGDFATVVGDGLLLDFLESCDQQLVPMYNQGKTIICDRFSPCFFAYIRITQRCQVFESVLQRIPRPSLVLYLSAAPEQLAERQRKRGGIQADEKPELQRRFNEAYRAYLTEYALNWIELDATQSPDAVLAQSCYAIRDFISKTRSI